MDSVRYDIYFTGKLVEGCAPEQAQQQFAQLFKMTPEKASKLFTGQPQLIKRGVEKTEALKYKQALHKAGMLTAFKAHQPPAAQATVSPSAQPAPTPDTQSTPASPPQAAQQAPASTNANQTLTLAPAGSSVLNDDERETSPDRDIDTSAIKLVSPFMEPEPAASPPAPDAPDTSHLNLAATGADILEGYHEEVIELDLDLSSMDLAPAGELLEQLKDDRPSVNPDISQISLAEQGADLLEGQAEKIIPPAPDTSHLSIDP